MTRPLGYDRPKPKRPRIVPKWNKRRCTALAKHLHRQTGHHYLVYSTGATFHTSALAHYPRVRHSLRHSRLVFTTQATS